MLTPLKRILLPALLLIFSASLQAVSLKPDAPERYEVKQGDSLWSIAEQYLQDPWMWPQLWQANPRVENPHLLYPGDILHLLPGEDFLRLKPRLRILALQEPIPFMPLERIESHLRQDLMVDRLEFEDSLYIVRIQEGRTLGGRGHQIDVLGNLASSTRDYGIYRDIREIRDPLTRRILGYKAESVGRARLVRDEAGYAALLEITENFQEIRVGDRLLPLAPSPFGQGFQPAPARAGVTGMVVGSLLPEQQLVGQYQAVLLNQGEGQLQPGDLLEVLEPGRQRRDNPRGPLIFAGENLRGLVMVYRVFENTSFALVMTSNQPIQAEDRFRPAANPRW